MSIMLSRVSKLVCPSILLFTVLGCDGGRFVEPVEENTVREPASLQLESLHGSVTEDDTVTVRAELLDGDGRVILDRILTWTTSDERIAHLQNADGAEATFVAKRPGSTTISASFETLSASTEVEVHNRPVDLVYIAGSGQQTSAGETVPGDLVVRAIDRRNDPVSGVVVEYAVTAGGGSLAPSMGVTDVDGYLRSAWTLGNAGTQTAEARASVRQTRVKNLKDSVVVFTAEIAVTLRSLEVNPSSATLEEGDTLQLDVEATASDGFRVEHPQISWESTDSTVVMIDPSGLANARRAGSARVIAKAISSGSTVSDTTDLLVAEGAATAVGVEVRPDTANVDPSRTRQFDAIALMSDGTETPATVEWRATGGTISSRGLYTAGSNTGTYHVIASHDGGYVDTAAVAIVAPATSVARVSVSPNTDTIEVGGTSQLTAMALDGDGNVITDLTTVWSSSEEQVAAVTGAGRVTALETGQSLITATTGGVSGTATIIVLPHGRQPGAVTDLRVKSIHADAVTLIWTQVDDGTGAAADYALRYGSPSITWDLGSATEARVSGTGVGKEVAYTFAGLTSSTDYEFQLLGFRANLDQDTVFGELSNIRSATTAQQQVARVEASPKDQTFTRVGENAQITAVGYDSVGNVVENAEFKFTSSNSASVSVDDMGLMTARALGTASIMVAAVCCDIGAEVEAQVTSDTTATYFVSTTGSDARGGTESAPWRTIGYALTQLEPGQTLYVRGGEYEENITNPDIQTGRPGARIRVAAYPGERPVLRGLLWLNRPSYWTIDGLNVTWSPANAAREHMVKMTNGVGWVYENAELWGARSFAGLLVYGSIRGEPADWTIRGNCIHDVRTDPIHHVNGDHNLYINTGTSAGAGLIERNILFGAPNGQNVKLGYGSSDPQPGHGAANVTVRYNTMYGALKNLMVTDESHHNTIERNIVVRSEEGYALRAYRLSGSSNVIRDNLLHEMRYLQYGDPGYDLVRDGGGNLLPHDPRFDSIGCSGFRPADETAKRYGRYAR